MPGCSTMQHINHTAAVILSCKAVIDYAGRYAKLAQEMAAQTSDPAPGH